MLLDIISYSQHYIITYDFGLTLWENLEKLFLVSEYLFWAAEVVV